MGSLGDELSLGSMLPITICDSRRGVEEHVKKLEEEKRKIHGSQLELPLCLQILNDAILYLKDENKNCSEIDDTQRPLLKDFISLNKPIPEEKKKFHQWNSNDTKIKNKLGIERSEEKSSNGLSMLLIPKVETGLGLGLVASSSTTTMVNGRRKGVSSRGSTSDSMPQPAAPPPFLQQQALRKQRRSWTPELHRRFVDALQQLGGPKVATPKQIREHMQEEGLTNDEVKSHLQKYRLHIRKPNSNADKQSAVVLGFKLWNSSQEEEETCEGGTKPAKRSTSQSGSPQGPLQLPSTTTTTGGDSSMEDAEDDKSESFQMERLRSP
ncbi:Transcription factor HHO6 [Cardamine amara subsp. amara]|uniref:Transcription factor HHO6 n=1 Tax=Cardamine amara subsp. amara TaxID=228776 RepID=A0ABD0ZPD9_CARAN